MSEETPVQKSQPITIAEFKMWLQGVEEMQEAGWSPSATQWQRIRTKIDDIQLSGSVAVQAQVPQYSVPRQTIAYAQPQQPAYDAPPSTLQHVPAIPPASGALQGGNILARTPDVDTSGGNYESTFA